MILAESEDFGMVARTMQDAVDEDLGTFDLVEGKVLAHDKVAVPEPGYIRVTRYWAQHWLRSKSVKVLLYSLEDPLGRQGIFRGTIIIDFGEILFGRAKKSERYTLMPRHGGAFESGG
jgi:hypothetical protein